jgi:hypothetical protein
MRGNLTRRCCCRARKLNAVMYPESRQEALKERKKFEQAFRHNPKAVKTVLVYVAREWAKVSVKEISRRLHRDPSIISRLYAAYAATRHHEKETRLAHIVLARLARGYLWLP